MTKGEVGVWNGPKKDDVIYEQPLTVMTKILLIIFLTIIHIIVLSYLMYHINVENVVAPA